MARSLAARRLKPGQSILRPAVLKQQDRTAKKTEKQVQWADLQNTTSQAEPSVGSEESAADPDVSKARQSQLNNHDGTSQDHQDHDGDTMDICKDDEDSAAMNDSFFDAVAIDVGTGAARETFKIVKSHAIARSRFFFHTLSVLNGHVDQSIFLPDVEAEIFEYFHDFLRMGLVVNRDFKGDVTSTLHKDLRYGRVWERLAKAWLLGEKLQSIPFRDAVVDAMIRKVLERGETPLDLYRILYRSDLKKKACIKRLLLDIALWTWKEDIFSNEIIREDLQENPDFFFDMAEILAKVRWSGLDPVPFYERNACYYYHEHVEEHRRCYRESRYASHEMQEKQEEALVRAEHPRNASPVQDELMPSPNAPSPVLAPGETVSTSELPSPTDIQDTEMVEDSSSAPSIEQAKGTKGVDKDRKPYYSILTCRQWDCMYQEQQIRLTHVLRIEESEDGKMRTPSCRRCRKNGWTCKVYKEEVREQHKGELVYKACARCIFDIDSVGYCAIRSQPEEAPVDLTD